MASTGANESIKAAVEEFTKNPPIPPKPWHLYPPEISYVDFVKRFIHTNDFNGEFICGDPDPFFEQKNHAPFLLWVKENHEEFIKIIKEINEDPTITRRKNIFYLLAVCLTSQTLGIKAQNPIKEDIRSQVLKLVKNDEEFFDYIRYFTTLTRKGNRSPKLSKTLRKLVIKFYNMKWPSELAEAVVKYERIHGWSHKDLIKLCHYKAENPVSGFIVQHILFGYKHVNEVENEDFLPLKNLLEKASKLRTSTDENETVFLIEELKASVNQINSKLNKNGNVWAALVRFMKIRDILQNLKMFYRRDWLVESHLLFKNVCDALTDETRVKESNLHPIEVYIYKRVFEKGGKKIDPRFLQYLHKKKIKDNVLKNFEAPLPAKCGPIGPSLEKCLKLSYQNIKPTGARFLITFDNSKQDMGCFKNRILSIPEAYYSIYQFLRKTEADVTAAVFVNNTIVLMNDMEQVKSATDLEKKLEGYDVKYIVPTTPIQWATNQDAKKFDVFINFQHPLWYVRTSRNLQAINPETVLKEYGEKMKLPNAKFVRIILGSNKTGVTTCSKNMLSIAGFTCEVPRVLEAFVRNKFI